MFALICKKRFDYGMFNYIHVPEGRQPILPNGQSRYAIIVVQETRLSDKYRAALSEEIAESRCVWMLAWGRDCSKWDDSVDWANILKFFPADIPEEDLIITTWHENEQLSEVMELARSLKDCTGEKIHQVVLLDFFSVERRD